jgi:hypothetical protein
MARSAGIFVLLAGAFFGYYEFLASLLPDYPAFLLNVIVIPGFFGVLAYVGLRGSPNSILWLLPAPVLVPLPLPLIFGGDPAKPGLEWEVYYVLVIFFALGEIAACFVSWLINRKKDREHVQA